jgi:DNA-binding PadR family transcriptional regulator
MSSWSGRTEQTFQILTALVDEPLHGYRIFQEVERISAGRTRLRVGALYAALDRLAREGLLVLDREEMVSGRLRRYYRLTDAGAQALADEADRLGRQAAVALQKLRWRGTARPAPAGGMA